MVKIVKKTQVSNGRKNFKWFTSKKGFKLNSNDMLELTIAPRCYLKLYETKLCTH